MAFLFLEVNSWYFPVADIDVEMHLAVGLIFGVQSVVRLYAVQRSEVVVFFHHGVLRKVLHPSPYCRRGTTHTVVNRYRWFLFLIANQFCCQTGIGITFFIIHDEFIILYTIVGTRVRFVIYVSRPYISAGICNCVHRFTALADTHRNNGQRFGIAEIALQSALYLKHIAVHQIIEFRVLDLPAHDVRTGERACAVGFLT